jgi:murein DD-endopeptidase MepM/ murein hydrolase activator NlpD
MQVPIIDPGAAAQTAAQATTSGPVPTATASAVQNTAPDSAVAWPIHGEITTQFGVPEPPFQPLHTGLDISDGKARGTTPVHPFKAGRVAGVIHTSSGLGNHVIVDHGDGLTSIYAHLNSTTVQTGQTVDLNTVLGYEGTTGASTGVHLHFEIRVNGQAVDPHGYIGGQP